MNKYFLSPLLGLLVIISGIAVTTSASAFELVNLYEGACLGVAAGTPTVGTKLVLWSCDGSANQQFTAVATSTTNANGESLYTLYNSVAANRVLGVAPVAQGNVAAPVVIWTVDYSANQQWTMTPVYKDHQGHQCYAIRSNGTFTMLTPSNRNTTIGSTYFKQYYDANGVVINTTYGDQSGNGYGTQDHGDAVIASYYIFGASFWLPLVRAWHSTDTPQLDAASLSATYGNGSWLDFIYNPNSYSAQYWCVY